MWRKCTVGDKDLRLHWPTFALNFTARNPCRMPLRSQQGLCPQPHTRAACSPLCVPLPGRVGGPVLSESLHCCQNFREMW